MNVIENDRQLKITRRWIRRFREQIDKVYYLMGLGGAYAPMNEIYLGAYKSQLYDLIIQVSKYLRKRNARINIKSIRYRNSI